jgi:hypothetical protein
MATMTNPRPANAPMLSPIARAVAEAADLVRLREELAEVLADLECPWCGVPVAFKGPCSDTCRDLLARDEDGDRRNDEEKNDV